MKILVVDDDNIIRMGLKKLIERLFDNHEVIANCQNGSAAYDYIKNNQNAVDLVITDIKMPIMTGIELIQKSFEELKKPPIFIVLSGYDEFTYVRDTMKMGAYNYLLKPIKNKELKDVIQEVEEKLFKMKNKDKLLNESMEILKRDFFKTLLFSNKEVSSNNSLFENMQLDEDYKYKMIVIDKCEGNIVSKFIKNILENNKNIENTNFCYQGKIYIIFYLPDKENVVIDQVVNDIVESTNVFIDNGINVYLFETTSEVYMLRKQSNIIRDMERNIRKDEKTRVYTFDNSEKVSEIFREEELNPNLTVIRLAKDFIINNYNKNITLREVADEVFLSQNYLSELFKREIGEGFYDFLSKYRIKKAKELLITTNIKIYEVAQRVGYNDSITFGRAFKKITGVTPNSFRNSRYGD